MKKDVYDRLVKLVGKQRADEMAAQSDETNRAITDANMVTRNEPTTNSTSAQTGAEHTHALPSVENTGAESTSTTAPASNTTAEQTQVTGQAPATEPAGAETRSTEFVIPDEYFDALVEALAQSAPMAQLAKGLADHTAALTALTPRIEQMETAQRTAQTAIDTRLAALEQDEETKRHEWTADRPREARSVELDVNGNPAPADSAVVANQTLSGLKSKRHTQAQHA